MKDNKLFEKLQEMAVNHPEDVEVYIDEDGEMEFEIDFDLFIEKFKEIFKL